MRATAAQPSDAPPLPPGLRVRVPEEALAAAWPTLCALQPVAREDDAVICAPRAAPEAAATALGALALPLEPLATVPAWPDPPAAMLAGWYRRSLAHLPAPAGVRELVQVAGEGFGPIDHPTTAMCLEALEALPAAPALDAGCGSGLLSQAWAALGRGPVLAVDLDARAIAQAAASLRAAGRMGTVTLRRGPLGALGPADLEGRVVLANVPADAQRALCAAGAGARPAAVVLSGLRSAEAGGVAAAWASAGLRPAGAWERGGFVCLRLVAG